DWLDVRVTPISGGSSQFFLPRFRYFSQPILEIFDGRKILFESGDLLFIAGEKSRIWRAIPNEIGLAVLGAASHFTSEVARSDMIAFAPKVVEDFEYALELLQLDLKDFPITERLVAKETALDTRALDELVWVPAIASSQEFRAFVKAGG